MRSGCTDTQIAGLWMGNVLWAVVSWQRETGEEQQIEGGGAEAYGDRKC